MNDFVCDLGTARMGRVEFLLPDKILWEKVLNYLNPFLIS